ncbi:unnamed protein product [Mucor hiemalis]
MSSSNTAMKRKRESIETMDEHNNKKKTISTINHFQNDLDHLFYEWNTINIVLDSIRNAFTVKDDVTEAHLDEVDRELSIAYDDLMSQVRHLERQLKRLTNEIHQKLIVQQQQWDRRPSTPTPNRAILFGVTSTQNK